MTKPAPFIDRFGLWTAEQKKQARALKALIAKHKLKLIRLVWSDTHGHARTKEVTIPAFLSALSGGYNINVATTTLDASGARTFASSLLRPCVIFSAVARTMPSVGINALGFRYCTSASVGAAWFAGADQS